MLPADTLSAIAHFERQLRPPPRLIDWCEDVALPRIRSPLPRHKRYRAVLARALMFGEPMPT